MVHTQSYTFITPYPAQDAEFVKKYDPLFMAACSTFSSCHKNIIPMILIGQKPLRNVR